METRRKVVTVVFADVVGSTALGERVDSETLRWAMQRWFDRMRAAVERHGGTIENYIGDAVMAVFGIPVAHEDDALRAVRAAIEMREEMAALRDDLLRERGVDLAIRIGINTGEAVTGAGAAAGSFTAGDTVNTAARLEQAAPPGEILLGAGTFRLVRHAVDAEPLAPLIAKGKSEALEAHRLRAVDAQAWIRVERPRAPMVGRQRERRRLLDAFHQAVADRSCQLFTVLGAAGVGKSRLVAEVVETIGDAATAATGRCLPYGDGLTWWPLAEAFEDSGLSYEAAEGAGERVADLLRRTGEAIAPDEAFWAVRKVLEARARERPLVLVVDDLQWAEPTFIDLVEHVADWSRDAPLLLLIMARNDLLDLRPGWAGGKLNATTVLLEPLPEDDARDLLGHLAGTAATEGDAASRILAVAEGNPLYVEEIVAMLIDDGVLAGAGGGAAELTAIAVPPTIQALIAARLDRLAPGERSAIEAASIQGKEFARAHVAALVGDGDSAGAHLSALVRKDLVRPAAASDDNLRFRHQLIRDVTYDGMSKDLRADLHVRFADLLDAQPAALAVADELVGYHLERSVTLRRELGASEAATAVLAARAAARLRAAGDRAMLRDDPASIALFERALALTAPADRAPVLLQLADALISNGHIERSSAAAAEAHELAAAAGDRRSAARARSTLLRARFDGWTGDDDFASFVAEITPVLDELEDLGDDEGAAQALLLLGRTTMDDFATASVYYERAMAAAERAGDRRAAAFAAGSLGLIIVFGPVPAAEGIERCRALRARIADHRLASAVLVRHEAVLHAMRGEFAQARRLDADYRRVIDDFSSPWSWANDVFGRWMLEMLAGNPDRAEASARASVAFFREMGATNAGSTAAGLLAQALVAQGRYAEALEYADLAEAWAAPDDRASQVGQLSARAHILAAGGDLPAAVAAARAAVRQAESSDDLTQRGDARVDLAEILERAGEAQEAQTTLRAAIDLYERKGNVVGAGRARAMLERLGARAAL